MAKKKDKQESIDMDHQEYFLFCGKTVFVLSEADGRYWITQVNALDVKGVIVGFTDESTALTEREPDKVIRALIENDNVRGRHMQWITVAYDNERRMRGSRDLDPTMIIVTEKITRLLRKAEHDPKTDVQFFRATDLRRAS